MKMTRPLTPWLTPLVVTACAVALIPAAARAQSGILHKRSYVPAPLVAPPPVPMAASRAATVSNMPADGGPGVVVEVPGSVDGGAGFVPGFPGHDVPGFEGGVVPLPAPGDLGDIVHIMPYPYPFEMGGPPPVSTMPGVDTMQVTAMHSRSGMQNAAAAAARAVPQSGARGLPERAVGVRSGAIAAPGSRGMSPTGSSGSRGHTATSLQPVGVERAATPSRWRDRVRFSWPGGSN